MRGRVADPDRCLLDDLRPLRGFIHTGALRVTPDVNNTVFGYDLLLLVSGTDRGTTTWEAAD